MLEKTLGDITKDDIQELVDDSVEESKELEYKQYLDPKKKEKNKNILLAEVTSFANSRGGDLIVGISENNGVPQNLGGIPLNKSADKTVETWGNILRRQTEPKLPTNIHDIRAT
jgi:predicted HTH transcriptional regulator